ncbi:hypothetical protein AVEN_50833-1 [Araneus ventricosus]|uniref:Uncharacterized protein n=1 Tax=Araneus ventricosus TaxID=182803 RepID=A0A4Y2TIQ5_ARAVE|nr:hypothetical protein AVEN_251462-1 [Araneus ventricosus]GBN99910.1 hypothetical protein AVEN_50833-1 [Araneus ventricosus]
MNLRDGIYKSCRKNPFSVMNSKIVDDIMSAALNHQRVNGFRADDLEQLLTSEELRELKIYEMNERDWYRAWLRSEVSVARTRSEVFAAQLRSEISEALGSLLENTPNLKDLHSPFSFDLKALRNCRKLSRLRLHFQPQQHWYEFLAKEKDHFQTHKCLEFFTVCHQNLISENVPNDDVVIILQHCPGLTSFGIY